MSTDTKITETKKNDDRADRGLQAHRSIPLDEPIDLISPQADTIS